MTNSSLIYLLRVQEVQRLVKEYTKKGHTQSWTYHNVIYPRFMMSKSTFDSYMSVQRVQGRIDEIKNAKNDDRQD